MNKGCLMIVCLLCVILVTSCDISDVPSQSEVITDESVATFVNPSFTGRAESTSTTSRESYSVGYAFDSNAFGISFDDVYVACENKFGIDFEELAQNDSESNIHIINSEEYKITYIDDFSAYLEEITEPDPVTGEPFIHPEEYEYHILRRIIVNDFMFDEFDDECWAQVNYSKILDMAYDHNSFIDESLYPNGYCFMYDESIPNSIMFYANYISGNCIMNYEYSFNSRNSIGYSTYLDLCEQLNLPTCTEMTEEIQS